MASRTMLDRARIGGSDWTVFESWVRVQVAYFLNRTWFKTTQVSLFTLVMAMVMDEGDGHKLVS